MKIRKEKFWHKLFETSVIIKGIDSVLELIGGILLLFMTSNALNSTLRFIFQHELLQDPNDFIANFLVNFFSGLSHQTQLFGALYLISHGVIKTGLVAGLLKKKLWVYPLSIIVFGLFILYQLYRYAYTHSLFLILLTLFDIIVIILILHEYRWLKHQA